MCSNIEFKRVAEATPWLPHRSAPGRKKNRQRLLKDVVSSWCSLSKSCSKPWFIVCTGFVRVFKCTSIRIIQVNGTCTYINQWVPVYHVFSIYIYIRSLVLKDSSCPSATSKQPSAARVSPLSATFLLECAVGISGNQERGQGAAKYLKHM